jgi:hypothetical protein
MSVVVSCSLRERIPRDQSSIAGRKRQSQQVAKPVKELKEMLGKFKKVFKEEKQKT